MRRDVLLLAAICCSLLELRGGPDAMRKEGHSMGVEAKIAHSLAA